MAIVILAPSLTVYEIFAKEEKCKNFGLENKGHGVEEWDLCQSTENVEFHIADYFSDFSYQGTYVRANLNPLSQELKETVTSDD